MFDLEYYNKVIEFGKWYDNIMDIMKKKKSENQSHHYKNKTQMKIECYKEMESMGTEIVRWNAFFGGEEYLSWYINYYSNRFLKQHITTINGGEIKKNLIIQYPMIMSNI